MEKYDVMFNKNSKAPTKFIKYKLLKCNCEDKLLIPK